MTHSGKQLLPNSALQAIRYSGLRPLPLSPELGRYVAISADRQLWQNGGNLEA